MSKLRTIIRLYEDQIGRKSLATMARTSRNTVKKYISKWNTLGLSYEEFQSKSDAELNALFCVVDGPAVPNARRDELEELLPTICGLTQFRYAVQRYRMISNPSMRMEHNRRTKREQRAQAASAVQGEENGWSFQPLTWAGDKMFVDFTGTKLWIYLRMNNLVRLKCCSYLGLQPADLRRSG